MERGERDKRKETRNGGEERKAKRCKAAGNGGEKEQKTGGKKESEKGNETEGRAKSVVHTR